MYAYRLAEELGYANVDLMLEEMDAFQLSEWQAYHTWKDEMEQRAIMQAKADAKVEQQRRGR